LRRTLHGSVFLLNTAQLYKCAIPIRFAIGTGATGDAMK